MLLLLTAFARGGTYGLRLASLFFLPNHNELICQSCRMHKDSLHFLLPFLCATATLSSEVPSRGHGACDCSVGRPAAIMLLLSDLGKRKDNPGTRLLQ